MATQLRTYQEELKTMCLEALRDCNSVMLQSPTGSGKTETAAAIIYNLISEGKKVLFFAHRIELVTQPAERFKKAFGIESGIVNRHVKGDKSKLVNVVSKDSYSSMVKKGNLLDADVIFIDEAHHAISDGYESIVKAHRKVNPNVKLIGLTATPYRLSGEGFKKMFDVLIQCSKTIKELENDKFLVPARIYAKKIGADEIARIKVIAGEYSEKDASKLMSEEAKVYSIVKRYIDICFGKQMLVYAQSIEHSLKIKAAFEYNGIRCAHIDGKTEANERNAIIDDFKNKRIQVLTNVGIATEGNDIPSIEVIALARLTKSYSLYLQMCGRGARPLPNKEFYYLLDFANCVEAHGRPNADVDWTVHFHGQPKSTKKSKKEPPKERKFKVVINEKEFIMALKDLPDDFNGEILEEYVTYQDPQTYVDKLGVFLDVAEIMGYKPTWALFTLANWCKEEGLDMPSEYICGLLAQRMRYSNDVVRGIIVKAFQ